VKLPLSTSGFPAEGDFDYHAARRQIQLAVRVIQHDLQLVGFEAAVVGQCQRHQPVGEAGGDVLPFSTRR
jgi:hypothetical protein